jgi:DNA-binding transcriptional ArsR family regulator
MTTTTKPALDELQLTSPQQIAAIGHPLRLGILEILIEGPATNSQLAKQMGQPPARLHHHVMKMLDAGLIEPAGSDVGRTGVALRYYRAVASQYRLVIGE